MSVYDKINQVKKAEHGTGLVHKIYKNKDGEMRTFKTEAIFKKWRDSHIKKIRKHYEKTLSPAVFHLT
jgi:hypothetical protein